jgi:hypothetical protein
MRSPVKFSESQAKANLEEAEKWAAEHNAATKDTVAHVEKLRNGNVRLWVQQRGAGERQVVTLPALDNK